MMMMTTMILNFFLIRFFQLGFFGWDYSESLAVSIQFLVCDFYQIFFGVSLFGGFVVSSYLGFCRLLLELCTSVFFFSMFFPMMIWNFNQIRLFTIGFLCLGLFWIFSQFLYIQFLVWDFYLLDFHELTLFCAVIFNVIVLVY